MLSFKVNVQACCNVLSNVCDYSRSVVRCPMFEVSRTLYHTVTVQGQSYFVPHCDYSRSIVHCPTLCSGLVVFSPTLCVQGQSYIVPHCDCSRSVVHCPTLWLFKVSCTLSHTDFSRSVARCPTLRLLKVSRTLSHTLLKVSRTLSHTLTVQDQSYAVSHFDC